MLLQRNSDLFLLKKDELLLTALRFVSAGFMLCCVPHLAMSEEPISYHVKAALGQWSHSGDVSFILYPALSQQSTWIH